MSRKDAGTQTGKRYWLGLDWGEEGHAVLVVDEHRTVVKQFKTGSALEDLHGIARKLHAVGSVAGIAIEATCHPVLDYLDTQGFTIYPVNPKLSKNWRESNSVAGVKSGERDGLVLALELARRHETLRVRREFGAAEAELAGFCAKTGYGSTTPTDASRACPQAVCSTPPAVPTASFRP